MPELAHTALSAWESFYVIVGSSGAALIGLQFVVIALIADTMVPRSDGSISAFGTPTVLHFGAALVISATMSAPWPTFTGLAACLVLLGVAGVIYTIVVVIRARRQEAYQPVFEDWLWHGILPFVAYAALASAASMLASTPRSSLFAIGGSALLLLLVGIHNSWDTVTYIVINRPRPKGD